MWRIICEGPRPNLPPGWHLLFEDQLENGQRLLFVEGPEEDLVTFLKEIKALSWEETNGEILSLPSGLKIKIQGLPEEKVLLLRSKGAFGSGFHPTTRLMLTLLEEVLDSSSPSLGLDFGAGSGILSLVAAKRGLSMIALEIEPQAASICAENALLNGLQPSILTVCGSLEAVRGPFDLILANIYLRLLIPQAKELLARLAPRGSLILSGFLKSTLNQILLAYRPLLPKRIEILSDWAAVWLTL